MAIKVSNQGFNKVVFRDANVKKNDDLNTFNESKTAKKVGSILDMVNLLENDTKENKNYNFIALCGHGAEGHQGLGSGTSGDYVKGKDIKHDKLDDITELLNRTDGCIYKAHENTKPVLFLAGCEVGKGTDGKELLSKLSKIFKNVVVVASTNKLTFKLDENKNVSVLRLAENGKTGELPPSYKFGINGEVFTEKQPNKIQNRTGYVLQDLILELELL